MKLNVTIEIKVDQIGKEANLQRIIANVLRRHADDLETNQMPRTGATSFILGEIFWDITLEPESKLGGE